MEAEMKRLAQRALKRRDLEPKRLDEQTLAYPFDPALAWLAVSYLRTPSRVHWDLFSATSTRLEPLYDELLAWLKNEKRPFVKPGMGLSVRVTGTEGFEAGPLQIQGTIKNALIDAYAKKKIHLHLAKKDPDLSITARGSPLTISIDLAGRSMHERGYRLDRGKAPLRENLAAQLLILARWDPRSEALIDPLCGSGTIAIEAAAMARGEPLFRPPKRPLAARLPVLEEASKAPLVDLFPGEPPLVLANELDREELSKARSNARRAGVEERVQFFEGDFRRLDRTRLEKDVGRDLSNGLILTNPPYGERVGGEVEETAELYRDLIQWAKDFGWRFAVLSGNSELERMIEAKPVLKKPLRNGPIKAYFLVYDTRVTK
jgi:putative N6-adenine-specific DNA methylase